GNFRQITQTVGVGAYSNAVGFGYDADGLLTAAGALTLTRHAQNGLLTGTSLTIGGGTVADTRTLHSFGELTGYSATSTSTGGHYSAACARDKLGGRPP